MPEQTSTDTPIPMAPLSSPCLPMHANCSHPSCSMDASATSSAYAASPVKKTSLVITIVTTEQVPDVNNSGTTTTIDRELKLRLTLPPSYDTKQLKSLNVKLHQDNLSPSCQPYGDSCSPSCVPSSVQSSCYNAAAEAQQQHWQEQQLRLFQAQQNHQVLPPPVLSSQDPAINATANTTTSDSSPLPETVSSSSSNHNNNNHNIGKTKRRSITAAATTAQSSSRKKRKLTNKANQPTQ